jgi:hypothetical protein
VADLTVLVRRESLGGLALSGSADLVSNRRRLGALGLRVGGGGRRKHTCEGGGEGVGSMILWVLLLTREEVIASGIRGNGDRGGEGALFDIADGGSISSNTFE